MDIRGLCELSKHNTLCGNLFSCHGREDADSPGVHTYRRSTGWMPSLHIQRGWLRRITKKPHFLMKSRCCRPTWHRLCTAAILLYWERSHPFSFCCAYQTTLFQACAQRHHFPQQSTPHNHSFHHSMQLLEVTEMISHSQIWLTTW